jgi:NRPS condensation-like uncharacterized protein
MGSNHAIIMVVQRTGVDTDPDFTKTGPTGIGKIDHFERIYASGLTDTDSFHMIPFRLFSKMERVERR